MGWVVHSLWLWRNRNQAVSDEEEHIPNAALGINLSQIGTTNELCWQAYPPLEEGMIESAKEKADYIMCQKAQQLKVMKGIADEGRENLKCATDDAMDAIESTDY